MDNKSFKKYTKLFNIEFHPTYFSKVVTPIIKFITSQEILYPYIIGISGGAAAGKTTLAKILELELIQRFGENQALTHSLDDFHYSANDRNKLGILWRGAPGAHNFEAMKDKLLFIKNKQFPVFLPKFSKITDDYGYPVVIDTPLRYFLIEGLIVGMRDEKHPEYKKYISDHLNILIFIESEEENLKKWRLDAEDNLRNRIGGGLSKKLLLNYWNKQLSPMLKTHINPIKKFAQIIINVNTKRKYKISFL